MKHARLLGPVAEYLMDHEIIPDNVRKFEIFNLGTRDNQDVIVFRCSETGVIFLNRIDRPNDPYQGRLSRVESSQTKDNLRRFKFLYDAVKGRNYVDVGCGAGGLLSLVSTIAENAIGVIPGVTSYDIIPGIYQLSEDYCHVASLIHVIEHMDDPIFHLRELKPKLKDRGLVFIEVPHANDFLLHNCDKFREFSLWSEHLILHTEGSLRKIIELAGYRVCFIKGLQRYPISNHMHWMIKGKPGGHEIENIFNVRRLNECYVRALKADNSTDTLFALAMKED